MIVSKPVNLKLYYKYYVCYELYSDYDRRSNNYHKNHDNYDNNNFNSKRNNYRDDRVRGDRRNSYKYTKAGSERNDKVSRSRSRSISTNIRRFDNERNEKDSHKYGKNINRDSLIGKINDYIHKIKTIISRTSQIEVIMKNSLIIEGVLKMKII